MQSLNHFKLNKKINMTSLLLEPYLNNLLQDENFVKFAYMFAVFLLNLTSYLYLFLKFFKVLCYSKMTFEWLPMINPHIWPFSVFNILTSGYFSFWAFVLPSIKLNKSSVEISGIVALEVLNSLIYFCVRFTNLLIDIIEKMEHVKALV